VTITAEPTRPAPAQLASFSGATTPAPPWAWARVPTAMEWDSDSDGGGGGFGGRGPGPGILARHRGCAGLLRDGGLRCAGARLPYHLRQSWLRGRHRLLRRGGARQELVSTSLYLTIFSTLPPYVCQIRPSLLVVDWLAVESINWLACFCKRMLNCFF
jgi:hypothetical protein